MDVTGIRTGVHWLALLLGIPLIVILGLVTGCCACGGPPPPQPTTPPIPTPTPTRLTGPGPTTARLPPEGWIFEATPCRVRGCAYDPKHPNDKIRVTLYLDKVAIGDVIADQDDVRQCETVRGHGFSFGLSNVPAGTRVEIVGTGKEPGDVKAIATATLAAPCK